MKRYIRANISDEDYWDLLDIANNRTTPDYMLEQLSTSEFSGVQEAVLCNPNVTEQIREYLSDSPFNSVRGLVAEYTCNPDLLDKLAEDGFVYVRYEVAENKYTSSDTLRKLSKDSSEYVRRIVACNPHTPEETLLELASDADKVVRETVASNTKNPEILDSLASHPDCVVRAAVANNPYTRFETLKVLKGDEVNGVASIAFRNYIAKGGDAFVIEDEDEE